VPPSKNRINDTTSTSYQYQRPESIKGWRADVSEALDDAGLSEMSERWLSCSEHPITKIMPAAGATLPPAAEVVFVCKGDHHHEAEVYAQTCDLRICPDCARRHAARLAARYIPKMLELFHQHHRTYRFRLVTFTLPYSLEEPDIRKKYLRGFKQVERVMSEMMSPKCPDWKSVQGFIVASEFGAEGYKLHYHVIHYGQYLEQAELARRWFTATNGDAFIVDVRGFPRKNETLEESVKEVFKYAVKFFSKDKITREVKCIPAHLIPALARCLDKTRRVRAYGLFFKLPDPDSKGHLCETCGSEMVGIPVSYFETFCNTGMLPAELWKASRSAELHWKPADKSPAKSTASPPENPEKPSLKQMQMEFLKNIRRMDNDW